MKVDARRRSAVLGVLALVTVALLSAGPARAGTTATLYLHSLPVTGLVQEAAEGNIGSDGPSLDATPPTNAAPAVSPASDLGNTAYRKNFLLAYWSGDLHGTVSHAVAHLWVASTSTTKFTVSLFSGRGVGVAAPFDSSTITVARGAPTLIDIPFTGAPFGVKSTLVLQASSAASGPTIVYDSASFASSISFDLDPYVGRAPPLWTPSAGFGSVSLVSSSLANREVSLAIDPTDERRMFVCSPSGVPNYPYGESYYHVSTDEGASWTPLYVETSPTDSRRATLEGGDCDVAFDDGGTMYTADTWLASLSIGASRDHGRTWTGTAFAASSPIVDRPWLVGGPPGTLHVVWHDVQALNPSALWYTRSTDYGKTFLPAVPVITPDPSQPMSWEGNLAVAPGGNDLFLVFTRRNDVTGGGETVWVASSHDAGVTWSSTLVARMQGPASYLYPSIARDESGRLHVVFASPTTTDQPVWYSTSANGLSWSAPIKLMEGVKGFAPWVAADAAGTAVVEWLGTPDPKADLGKAHDWYVYWARVEDGTVASSGTTTTTPIYSGVQSATPEFDEIRLDSNGRMRIATAVNYAGEEDTGWGLLYQSAL